MNNKLTHLNVTDAHFRTGSAVMLPEGTAPATDGKPPLTSALAAALRFNEERPGHRLLIAGHTDSMGGDKSNDRLSDQRAELVHAVLMGGAAGHDKFVELALETGTVSDWKQILKWAALAFPTVEPLVSSEYEDDDSAEAPAASGQDGELGTGFTDADPGVVDENAASADAAVRAFQTAYNDNYNLLGGTGTIGVDGDVGKQTWGAIFDLYQHNIAFELGEDFAGVAKLREVVTFLPLADPFIGFGESAPVDGVHEDDEDDSANRRVEVLFFETGQEPDLTLLKEDPKSSELYLPEMYVREEIERPAIDAARVIGVKGIFDYVVEDFPLLDQPKAFQIAMRKVFGDDLPNDSIESLRKELESDSFPEPDFALSDSLPAGVSGAYTAGVIHVARELAEEARCTAIGKWKLFSVMLEEYGHHVDDQLRNRLASDIEHDSLGDEGTRFGAFYISYHELFTNDLDAGHLVIRRGLRKPTSRLALRLTEDDLGPDERAKFFLWAQEEGSDAGFVTIDGVTYQAEYFKIEGQGAVHERITMEAAKAAAVKFDGRLDKGIAWPDVPTWDENSPPIPSARGAMTPDQLEYNSTHAAYAAFLRMETAHRMGIADKSTPPFKSHYGKNQIWHSMSPGGHLTNGQVVEGILKQHEIWWGWAMANRTSTVGISLPLSILPQGLFHVGKLLHTVQDSFSESHTVRNNSGEIKSFQDYTKQDVDKHGERDKDVASKALHDIPGAPEAIKHSAEILKLFKARSPFSTVREYLLQRVFKLEPGAAGQASGVVPPEFLPD